MLVALIRWFLNLISLGAVERTEVQRNEPGYFSPEYRRHLNCASWFALRRTVIALTLGRDLLCPLLRANSVDHLSYRRLGREIPFLDVIPLNRGTHRVVTMLRDAGLRGPITLIIRIATLTWLFAYLALPTIAVLAISGHLQTAIDHLRELVAFLQGQVREIAAARDNLTTILRDLLRV